MVGIQDVFNILGDAMPFRGELGDVYDLTIFKLPRVLAQSAVSPVWLASASLVLRELLACICR
jgi:hypothetical protein